MPNLFLPIYHNLEKETLKLSEDIFFNDEQLKVYSTKIAELLIRTVVEIESLSKELYFKNGGQKKEPYFDTDCIALLEQKWELSKKEVLVIAPNFYFQDSANKILTPLRKASKHGTSGSDWKKAYQAVKHDRSKNFKKASVKNLLQALGALYILNVYNKTDEEIRKETSLLDTSFGSRIFSAKKQVEFLFTEGMKQPNDKSCICIEKVPDYVYKKIIKAYKEDTLKQINFFKNSPEGKTFLQKHPDLADSKIKIAYFRQSRDSKLLSECLATGKKALQLFLASPKEIILNKGQEIYHD